MTFEEKLDQIDADVRREALENPDKFNPSPEFAAIGDVTPQEAYLLRSLATKHSRRLYELMEGQSLRNQSPKEYLRSLSYSDFLKSPYWKLVRQDILFILGPRCRHCNDFAESVDVHHKTYEHHGEELDFLADLTVLCRPCHESLHYKAGRA